MAEGFRINTQQIRKPLEGVTVSDQALEKRLTKLNLEITVLVNLKILVTYFSPLCFEWRENQIV